jgi:hypothetical protein
MGPGLEAVGVVEGADEEVDFFGPMLAFEANRSLYRATDRSDSIIRAPHPLKRLLDRERKA